MTSANPSTSRSRIARTRSWSFSSSSSWSVPAHVPPLSIPLRPAYRTPHWDANPDRQTIALEETLGTQNKTEVCTLRKAPKRLPRRDRRRGLSVAVRPLASFSSRNFGPRPATCQTVSIFLASGRESFSSRCFLLHLLPRIARLDSPLALCTSASFLPQLSARESYALHRLTRDCST